MHPLNYKFIAGQAHRIYAYKNIRKKVQRCCASIYFNQQCLHLGVTPKYANIYRVILFTAGIPCRCTIPLTILSLDFRPDDDRLTIETCCQ